MGCKEFVSTRLRAVARSLNLDVIVDRSAASRVRRESFFEWALLRLSN